MNAKKEKLLNDTYQKWMQAGLYDLPLDKINEFVDPKIMGYGTAIDEKVLSISEYKQLINRQREQAVGIEMDVEITPVFRSVTNQEDAAIFVDEIKVKMIIGSEKFKIFLRITTLFEYIDSKWIVIHWHGSIPTETKAEDDAWLVNEWKRKNAELEKLVAEKTEDLLIKNKELEIESALEKVRSSALSMKQPGDMVDVCRIISDQLELLGVNDIRNVQTAIINEQKVTYLNYQYFAAYKEGVIEETNFNKHPTVFAMVEEMKKSANSTFSGIMKGKELVAFREWRKLNHQFPDPILDKVDSVHYYFYSIGLGGLGLTTYKPLPEEGLDVFKRFHNVFTLAYRRFVDIEKAEAQAREAKIEAALERVRSRSMAMHSSDEFVDASDVMVNQLKELGIDTLRIGIGIINKKDNSVEIWSRSEIKGKIKNTILGIVPAGTHPIFDNMVTAWKEKKLYFSSERVGDEVKEYYDKLDPCLSYPKRKEFNERETMTAFFFNDGSLNVISLEPLKEEDCNIMIRFAKVFGQIYQRFLDLQKAEAQAREAHIEAALERVRSRSMGMQKSEELKEVIRVVYEQFVNLKINVDHAGFVVDYTPRGDWHFWIADEQDIPSKITHPYFESVWANQFNEAKEKGEDFFATNLNFEEKNKFYKELLSYVPGLPEASKDFYLSCPGLAGSTVLLDNVGLYIENFSGIPYTDEDNKTLMRFGKVFQQTYTRFLDLQKAETQAREAQIEAALERTRTKSMLMQHSNELKNISNIFHEQLLLLGIPSEFSYVWLPDEEKGEHQFWATWAEDNGTTAFKSKAVTYPLDKSEPYTAACFSAWKSDKPVHIIPVPSSEVHQFFATWEELLRGAEQLKPEFFPEGLFYAEAYMKYGCFGINIRRELKGDEGEILRRFTIEFERAYTRFLDLQKAEAQNKIIQAENERKTKELEDARQLQLAMLPRELPKVSNLDIAVYMKTATEVGGDYYDFHIQPDGTLNVLVGDATGHGMMSGMMVSIMKSFFIANRNIFELKQFFENSNVSIKDMQLGRLMMACIGVQITSEKVIATNAGMPSLLYFRNKSQKAGEFVINNMPLGAMKESKYAVKEINYEIGDTLLLMSDGFAELKNKNKEQYGYERAKEDFKSVVQKSADEIIDHLKNSASEWANGVEPDDDLTFVVIKVK